MPAESYKGSDMTKKITYILLCVSFCITWVHGQKANYQIESNGYFVEKLTNLTDEGEATSNAVAT